jgi:deoxyribonuclease V
LKSKLDHNWNVDFKEAKRIQNRLKKSLVSCPYRESRFIVAGIDVSYMKELRESCAAIAVMTFPEFELLEVSISRIKTSFPYVPGYLSFREAPAILDAWKKLRHSPDLLMFDGQGLAHPRRFGIACHVGLLLGKPSIGCAKSHLYGKLQEPSPEKGSSSNITDPADESVIGVVLRTRFKTACVYVSPGHRMDVSSAVRISLALTPKYRIPEPLRFAHTYSKKGWESV